MPHQPTLYPLNSSVYIRILSLIVIILVFFLAGNALLLVASSYFGVSLGNREEILQLLENDEYTVVLKIITGLNHLLIFFCAPLVFLWIFYRKNILGYLQLQHFDARYLLLFPIALYALYPLMGYVAAYLETLDLPDFMSQMDQSAFDTLTGLLHMDNFVDLLINLVIMAVIPAVGEELLFRGVVQKEIYVYTNRAHTAIWVTAFLFAVLHFQITGFAAKFLIGVILGYAYHFSGSLILPIILHMINNGLATIAYYLAGDQAKEAAQTTSGEISLWGVLSGLMICGITMFYINFISLKRNTIY